MLNHVKERVGRWGDALLARLAPKLDAEAVCAGWEYCCVRGNSGSMFHGKKRVDPEHNGDCTACYYWASGC